MKHLSGAGGHRRPSEEVTLARASPQCQGNCLGKTEGREGKKAGDRREGKKELSLSFSHVTDITPGAFNRLMLIQQQDHPYVIEALPQAPSGCHFLSLLSF